ncbi:DUF4153 domain-containing protein [Chryseobacterium flavum]|uniref:DUF4153 domain-containing protein n=1 Tax=Chryseobacterium flavum TaxID=415851 RepID=A0A3D9CM34_9FLAO|nr:DUF4153 domain-containing protein [Chryseobacterium flavum]REC66777.1 DUF4153 domain-containing protein [Chryseobacterium flavum]
MKIKLLEITGKAREVILRYPMVLLMALLGSAGAICLYETNYSEPGFIAYSKFTMCSCLGISLMFALKMLSQRIGKSYILESAGIIFLVGFYFIFPDNNRDFTEVYQYIIIVTFLLSHLFVSFAAFLNRNKEPNFWQYNKNLFVNTVLTIIFTGVLTGGIELAVLAVDKLFDFKFSERIYLDLFFFMAISGSCLNFLIFNENGLPYLEKDSQYPVVLKFFTQFILIPLLLIYVIILYFYAFKILINWELPRGWVSYLVLAYSIVGILALLLVHPLKADHTKSWVKAFSRLFFYTIIPLVILLFVAIFTRILEYGYTEPRYFVLLLAVWLTGLVVYFVFNKKASIRFIPVSLFVAGTFSLVFPYLNAFSVAKRSQKTELIKILNNNHLLSQGKIDFNKKVSEQTINKITSQFVFLAERKEKDFLLNLISDAKIKNKLTEDFQQFYFWNINNSLKNAFVNVEKKPGTSDYKQIILESETDIMNIQDYQYMIRLQTYAKQFKEINGDTFTIDNQTKINGSDALRIILNSKEEIDFIPAIHKLFQKNTTAEGIAKLKEISVENNLGKYHIKIIFRDISKGKYSYSIHENFYYNDAVILIRENK